MSFESVERPSFNKIAETLEFINAENNSNLGKFDKNQNLIY